MGFFKDIISKPLSLGATGFMGLGGAAVTGLYNRSKRKEGEAAASAQNELDLYNNQTLSSATATAEAKKKQYYGNTLDGMGKETEDYVGRMKGNLDKNVAKADIYNRQQGQARGLAETRAGLSGLDNTALNEGSRRRGSFEAAAINEDAKRNALDLYGKSISNRIEGANSIDNSEKALAIASMKQPQTNYQPGLLGGLFKGFLG